MTTPAHRLSRIAFFVAVGLGVTLTPLAAFAQESSEHQETTLETPQMREAKERYGRGLKLFADKDYEAARIEFKKAYELVPSFKILYNIGVCDANRNDYVGAIENLQKYVAQGGTEVPADRRAEVESLLKDIRPRVGHIMVTSEVNGAVVAVDDVQVGTTPLAQPLEVNPGMRKVTVSKPGYIPQTQAITVAGSETDNIALNIQPTITIKKGVSPWPFVLWGTTAALAIGAGITGYLAIKNSDDLSTMDGQPPPAGVDAATYAKQLESKRSDMRTFSIIADTLTGAAVVVGAVALVVTVVTFGKHHKEGGESMSLVVRPGGLGLAGTF
jgi:hypothetical protein